MSESALRLILRRAVGSTHPVHPYTNAFSTPPDCPLVDQVRATLIRSLAKVDVEAVIEEMEGPYPSPTLLIEGIDVTGHTSDRGASCRLDLPTEEQVLAALSGS